MATIVYEREIGVGAKSYSIRYNVNIALEIGHRV